MFSPLRIFAVASAVCALRLICRGETLPEITRLADVRCMPPAEAARGYPVTFEGTVLIFDRVIPERKQACLFVHDGTTGIYVYTAPYDLDLHPGERIRVKAETCQGDFAPCIRRAVIEPLGGAAWLPHPIACTTTEVFSGKMDSQWVELPGVGRAVLVSEGRLALQVASDGFRFTARFADPTMTREDLTRFIDAEIRVRGVCYSDFTSRRQLFGVRLYTPGAESIEVEAPAPADPFSGPARRSNELLTFDPNGSGQRHRVKIAGTVALSAPGKLLLVRDRAGGILVRTDQTESVAAGDLVEVAGFPVFSGYTAALEDAAFRVIGRGEPAPPTAVTLKQALSGDWQAELITMQGRVIENTRESGGQRFVVQSGSDTFRALLSQPPYARLEPGALAEFTGVCLAEGLRYEDPEGWRPLAFELLLESEKSVKLLTRPSWWTVRRVTLVLASVAAILLIALIWAGTLQFQVRKQTERIRSQVDREAVLEERNRIAREIHDTLAQAFAGTAFQLEAVEAELKTASSTCRAHLDHARAMIRHGLAQARRSVTEMRGQSAASRAGLSDLKECAELLASDSDAQLHIEITGEPFALSPLVENNLLRIAQEALINALRHATPRHVWLNLHYGTDRVHLEIADDGCGFDIDEATGAPGHFGLIGIRERAREASGALELIASPGNGARIFIEVRRPQPADSGVPHPCPA